MTTRGVVYVIDDDDGFRDSVLGLAASAKLTAIGFESPCTFLKEYRDEPCACAVLDIRMPEMTGIQLMHVMRDNGIEIPVIFVTAWGDVDTAVRAMRAGAADFIQKPFQPQELLHRIHEQLAQSTRNTAHRRRQARMRSIEETLTFRERQIMSQLKMGSSAEEVGARLALSRKTVYFHQKNLLRKLGLTHPRQLILMNSTEPPACANPETNLPKHRHGKPVHGRQRPVVES